MREPEQELFPQAAAHRTGVVIMSTTRTGKLLEPEDAPPVESFYRYVLRHPAVNVALLGLRDVTQFRHLAEALAVRATLSDAETHGLEQYGTRMRELEDIS